MERLNVIRKLEDYKRDITRFLELLATRRREYPEWPASKWYDSYRVTDISGPRCLFLHSLAEYLKLWIKKLSSCDCEDPYLIAVFINLYNAWKLCSLIGLRDEIISIQQLSDRDLTDVREGINYRLIDVGRTIGDEDWTFLKVLILYGVIRSTETFTSSVQSTHTVILMSFLHEIPLRMVEDSQLLRLPDLLFSILPGLSRKSFDSADADGKAKILRKLTVVKSLAVAVQYHVWGTIQATTVRKCLSYYFQVIPDPFVTVREIEDMIEIPQTSQTILERHSLRCFLIEYRKVFPESEVLQPRSLEHLSRCAARKHLCKYGPLPNVVSRLMIPKAIKDYLLVVNNES